MSTPARDIYLAPHFDPASLKVPQLRSILIEHGIYFPSTSKKADLVGLFTSQLQPRGADILAADAKVRPSGHGIIAVSNTGDEAPLVVAPPVPATPSSGVKRGRGRPKKSTTTIEQDVVLEHAPTIEEDVVAEHNAPPAKKARSRRQTSEAVTTVEPTPKKRGRPRKIKDEVEVIVPVSPQAHHMRPPPDVSGLASTSAAPSTASRRKSIRPSAAHTSPPSPQTALPAPPRPPALGIPTSTRKPRTSFAPPPVKDELSSEAEASTPVKHRKPRYSSEQEDSGFSDFNPFQAGSEQAAEKERRRRKSSLGMGGGGESTKRRAPRPSEWTATSAPTASILRRVGPSSDNLRSPPDEVRDAMRQQVQIADEYNTVVQTKLGDLDQQHRRGEPPIVTTVTTTKGKAIVRRKPKPAVSRSSAVSLIVLSLLLLGLAGQYKAMSSANGFCDPGSTTNDVIQGREAPIAQAQQCIARRTTARLEHADVIPPLDCDLSALPLVPFMPRPTTCTPCPQFGRCSHGEVDGCIAEYIESPHPLAFLGPLVDGWPGMPSRVFSPKCKPDTALMRQIGTLAGQVERELAVTRGDIVCAGEADGNKPIAESFGTDEDSLRESFAERRLQKVSREQFDEIFDSAMRDLVAHNDVLTSIAADGTIYYASARTDLTLKCRLKLEATSLLDKWKSQLVSTAAVILGIWLFLRQMEQRAKDKQRAHELVGTVLRRLQDQEYQHYLDPVVTPQPYLPPAQLRDVVLPASESAASRARLWAAVEAEIEKNANIAVREREVRGDVWKTWEWSGVGGRPLAGM